MVVTHRGWVAVAGAVLMLSVAVASAPASSGRSAATPAEYRTLVSAARQTLAARALSLVEGAHPTTQEPLAAGNVVRSARFAVIEAAALRSLAGRRDRLRTLDEVYLAAQTEVRFAGAQRSADRLRLTLTELTTLYRDRNRGGPDSTAFEASRTFDFVLERGRWTLTGEALLDDGPAPITQPDPPSEGSLTLTPSGGFAEYD